MKRILIIFTIILAVCGGTYAQQSNLVPFQLPLDGRLISGLDPSKLIDTTGKTPQISNFATLTNMEYTDNGIRSVRGMTKITTSPLSSHPRINNIFQFVKSNPVETHIMVHASKADGSESVVFELATSTPNTGTVTPTILYSDSVATVTARFNNAPIGHVIYCNGVDPVQVWGGNENKPGQFIIYDGSDPATT